MKFVVLNMFFFGFSVFLIGVLIVLKRWDEVSRRWFCFSVAVAGYTVGYGLVFINDTPNSQALIIARVANAIAVFIPATWLYFVCSFLSLKRDKLFRVVWPITFILALAGLTKLAIPSVDFIIGGIRHPTAGPTLHLQTINYFCMVSYGFYLMFRSFFQERVVERKREIFSLILATIFGFIGGAGEFSIIYFRESGIDLSFLLVTYPFIMAYVMIKQHVLDVETIVDIFQREKLATIGLLAASVNHEIRNPLYGAKSLLESYLEMKKEGLASKDPDQVSEKALKQIERALDVITKLNRFAKPAVDGVATNSQASIQEALKSVLDLVSYEFELDKIHIKNEINPQIPMIQADQRQLEEILFNLIVNACHAIKERDKNQGGTLEISASCHSEAEGQRISRQRSFASLRMTKPEERKVLIEIKDSGSGISPEQAKHLFEPFHTTKGENGTGLGLYITKQLVERNDGRIFVKSKEEKGTSFALEFKIK